MQLHINGEQREVHTEPAAPLLGILRNELDLTGTKYGCGEAACGACMVLVDGNPTPACVTPAGTLDGKKIVTIEGLETGTTLHRVQQAFLEVDPFQCSYCASGMIISAVALLQKNSTPTDDEIIAAMNRNICRCGTYPNIVKAIRAAAKP